MSTPQDLDDSLREAIGALAAPVDRHEPDEPLGDGPLTGRQVTALFDAQLTSRHLDLAARWLRSFGEGYAATGSSGHEGNAAVAAALRPTDPALPHYRSGAFYCVRAAQCAPAGTEPAEALIEAAREVLRGIVASAADPGTGGRHQLFGRADLNILPVTGNAGAHLPRAVGVAFAIERSGRLGAPVDPLRPLPPLAWPEDAVAVCSFGDATVNHATALAAFNTAGWCDHSGLRLPLLLVCEDNGVGRSAPSPPGWVEAALRAKPGLRYLAADGTDPIATYAAASDAVEWVRRHRRPAVLHLATVRLLGGGQGDPAPNGDPIRDPLVTTARLLVEGGFAEPGELLGRYDEIGWRVRKVAEEVIAEPKLDSAVAVLAPLAPRRPARVARLVADLAGQAAGPVALARSGAFGTLPEERGPMTMAEAISATLADALLTMPRTLLFGEDVALRGGAHGVTAGLRERFGAARVFDTLRDETSVLGLALGSGVTGLLPVPEIPYLARVHSAEEQIRGEAATLRFLSAGTFRNPIVLRLPGLGYHDGGGPFAGDNALAVLRDVPGLVVAVPSRADDAAAMLRTCLASAQTDGTVCAFVEPIAQYYARDLYADGDGEWLANYPAPVDWAASHAPVGQARVYRVGPAGEGGDPAAEAADLTIIAFGNGVPMSLRVARQLAAVGVGVRVVDLRWLAPLPVADIVRESAATGRVLVVDETRRAGGVGEGVLAALVDAGYVGVARRVAALDSFVPLGPAARQVLLAQDWITQGARALLGAGEAL